MGLSTHILDTANGKPAVGVEILLEKQRGSTWRPLARAKTDSDGRCKTLLNEHEMEAAIYRLRFFTGPYFESQKLTGLYPYIDIAFEVRDPGTHYHIPLLLTANGYTTYRGS
jgi:5-hydroxyisourate hydrolase